MTEYGCQHLILATGGAGQMYRVSTNPAVATGDGIALAYRAGAEIMDMEFVQFHPTALRLPGVQPFLISEAVRGEGGILRDTAGERFMPEYHPKAELAPRDVVARAIVDRMQETGADHVLLDITHLEPSHVLTRFPQIYRFCLDNGLDITREPIPVSPAAHYTMGGIRTNTWGETTRAAASTPAASAPAPAYTAPTAWRRTRCWRRWCSRSEWSSERWSRRDGARPRRQTPSTLSEPQAAEVAPVTRERLCRR